MKKCFWALGGDSRPPQGGPKPSDQEGGATQNADSEQKESAPEGQQPTASRSATKTTNPAPAGLQPPLVLPPTNPFIRTPSLRSPLPFQPPMDNTVLAVAPDRYGPSNYFPTAATTQWPATDGNMPMPMPMANHTPPIHPPMPFSQGSTRPPPPQDPHNNNNTITTITTTYPVTVLYRLGTQPNLIPDADQTGGGGLLPPVGWARSTRIFTETRGMGGGHHRDTTTHWGPQQGRRRRWDARFPHTWTECG
jgi:hypothetical protein